MDISSSNIHAQVGGLAGHFSRGTIEYSSASGEIDAGDGDLTADISPMRQAFRRGLRIMSMPPASAEF
ncbi:GLUG motif-containing protein [Cohnella boryungensis]|uniref:GLUG motif-containing protein n=1 Tax=Cohnella boryungensis TaxID=768479 RepID=A0ABV8SFV3_9BACL